MQWNEIYSFQKILPLLTRWQLQNTTINPTQNITDLLKPKIINKKRILKGVPSYEIVWDQNQSVFKDLIPQEQIDRWLEENENNLDTLYSTVEPQDLVDKMCPQLVDAFIERTKKPEKTKKKKHGKSGGTTPRQRKRNKTNNNENINPNNKNVQQKKIFDFIKPLEMKNDDSFNEILSDSEFNMSDIIKNLIKKSPVIKSLNGKVLRYDSIHTSSPLIIKNPSTSSHPIDDSNFNDEILEISMNHLSLHELSHEVDIIEEHGKMQKMDKSNVNLRSEVLKKTLNQKLDKNHLIDTLSDSLDNIRLSFIEENYSVVSKNDECSNVKDETKEVSAINIDDSFGLVNYVPITKNFKKKLF